MKTIILGLGNTILTDDGAGIYVTRRLKECVNSANVAIVEASIGGFNFIDTLAGYKRAVIIDAIHTKDGRPGEFYELDPKALKASARLSSLHGLDFATVCEMAPKMGIDFPDEIRIYVIEVEDEFSFGESCTPAVQKSIPKMAGEIFAALVKEGWI